MTIHGTASKMSTGQFREFAGAVLRSLPDDLSEKEAQRWIQDQESLRKTLRGALVPSSSIIDNVFPIICEGGVKTSDLVRRGNYDWANSDITDARFPILEVYAPVSRVIELVKFDHNPRSEEVLAEFAHRGLERPTYEDALVFGIQHRKEQRKHSVVFLHEPVQVGGHRRVLVLDENDRRRYLGLYWVDDEWLRRYVFAAVRK